MQEDSGYTLLGGPVDALIAYAASSTKAGEIASYLWNQHVHVFIMSVHVYMCTSNFAVKHFSEAFLLTYYTFITPEELISKLLYR